MRKQQIVRLLFLLGLVFMVIQSSCKGQKNNKKKNERIKDSTEEIIVDPIEKMAFEIKRDTVPIVLPDSLGGKIVNGWTALKLEIDKNGIIKNFEIIRLFLKKGSEILMDYSNVSVKNKYPDKIKPYYHYLSEHVKRIKIIPSSNVHPKTINIMYVIIKFK
jgi:hypothetical protein